MVTKKSVKGSFIYFIFVKAMSSIEEEVKVFLVVVQIFCSSVFALSKNFTFL